MGLLLSMHICIYDVSKELAMVKEEIFTQKIDLLLALSEEKATINHKDLLIKGIVQDIYNITGDKTALQQLLRLF